MVILGDCYLEGALLVQVYVLLNTRIVQNYFVVINTLAYFVVASMPKKESLYETVYTSIFLIIKVLALISQVSSNSRSLLFEHITQVSVCPLKF
jgi:hypothetical protein